MSIKKNDLKIGDKVSYLLYPDIKGEGIVCDIRDIWAQIDIGEGKSVWALISLLNYV